MLLSSLQVRSALPFPQCSLGMLGLIIPPLQVIRLTVLRDRNCTSQSHMKHSGFALVSLYHLSRVFDLGESLSSPRTDDCVLSYHCRPSVDHLGTQPFRSNGTRTSFSNGVPFQSLRVLHPLRRSSRSAPILRLYSPRAFCSVKSDWVLPSGVPLSLVTRRGGGKAAGRCRERGEEMCTAGGPGRCSSSVLFRCPQRPPRRSLRRPPRHRGRQVEGVL